MEKLYYSISETAQELGEQVSCIRFWTNSFPKQLKPHRTAKGNRQYTAQDIEVLKQIQYLLKTEGLTIEGAARKLGRDSAKASASVKALESLKNIREQLLEIRNSL